MKWKSGMIALAVALLIGGAVATAATEQDVTLTVTIRSLGVSVTATAYDFGYMNTGETKVSGTALVVKNEGNDAEDIGLKIKTQDSWGEWTAASAVAANVYVLSSRIASTAGAFVAGDVLSTALQWCDGTKFGGGGDNMTSLASENLWFQFQSPTSITGDHASDQHTITVEVSCRQAE